MWPRLQLNNKDNTNLPFPPPQIKPTHESVAACYPQISKPVAAIVGAKVASLKCKPLTDNWVHIFLWLSSLITGFWSSSFLYLHPWKTVYVTGQMLLLHLTNWRCWKHQREFTSCLTPWMREVERCPLGKWLPRVKFYFNLEPDWALSELEGEPIGYVFGVYGECHRGMAAPECHCGNPHASTSASPVQPETLW